MIHTHRTRTSGEKTVNGKHVTVGGMGLLAVQAVEMHVQTKSEGQRQQQQDDQPVELKIPAVFIAFFRHLHIVSTSSNLNA
jgi:hypothetical protein